MLTLSRYPGERITLRVPCIKEHFTPAGILASEYEEVIEIMLISAKAGGEARIGIQASPVVQILRDDAKQLAAKC